MNDTIDAKPTRKSSAIRYLWIGLVVFVLLVACLPWIVANSPLRNSLINGVIADPDLTAKAGSASFGWFSSLAVNELEVRNETEQVKLDVASIKADKSWLGLWMALPDDAGTIRLEQPQLELVAPEEWPEAEEDEPETVPTATIIVDNAGVKVFDSEGPDPVIDLKNLNLTLKRTRGETGGELTIEPITVFDRVELTPEICDSGLQLIAPALSDAANVQGKVSFSLSKFRVPLEWNERTQGAIDIEGNLKLHSVDASLKDSPIMGGLKLAAMVLRIDLPETMRITDEADIHFFVRDGRIHHEGLAFGLPEVSEDLVIRSSGSVGLDETLDLRVEIPIPLSLLRERNEGGEPPRLRKPIVLVVRGTLDEPKVELPDDKTWATELVDRLLLENQPGEDQPLVDSLRETLGGLLDRKDGEPDTPILDRWRKRREERRRRRD